ISAAVRRRNECPHRAREGILCFTIESEPWLNYQQRQSCQHSLVARGQRLTRRQSRVPPLATSVEERLTAPLRINRKRSQRNAGAVSALKIGSTTTRVH